MPIKTLKSQETIATGFAKFLDYASERSSHETAKIIQHYLEDFIGYAELELPDLLSSAQKKKIMIGNDCHRDKIPVGLSVKVLDRYFRYHLLREMITTPEGRGNAANAIFHCMCWMQEQKILSNKEALEVKNVSDRLAELNQICYEATMDLADFLSEDSTQIIVTKLIDFGRHDVKRIEGDKIWLEIWSLPELPPERMIGPLTVPQSVADVLEPGWMITCMLGLVKKEWQIIECGAIYPSLPFNGSSVKKLS